MRHFFIPPLNTCVQTVPSTKLFLIPTCISTIRDPVAGLLQQLNESAEGLEALPEPELSEIVSSAIRVCGFIDPIEVRA